MGRSAKKGRSAGKPVVQPQMIPIAKLVALGQSRNYKTDTFEDGSFLRGCFAMYEDGEEHMVAGERVEPSETNPQKREFVYWWEDLGQYVGAGSVKKKRVDGSKNRRENRESRSGCRGAQDHERFCRVCERNDAGLAVNQRRSR